MQNPIEFCHEIQFVDRFKFPNRIVLDIFLPIIMNDFMDDQK